MNDLPPIKWTCVYCRKPQESPDLPPFEGEAKPYSETIKAAAKSGSIACWDCFHWLIGRVHK